MKGSGLRIAACLVPWLAVPLAVACLGGLLLPSAYAKETLLWAVQGMGQDTATLGVALPLLLVSAFLTARGSRVFSFALAGTYLYLAYSYALYAFCVHFNALFFFYCAVLGLSVYGLVFWAKGMAEAGVEGWFDRGGPVRLPALFLMTVAALFLGLWLREDVPAVLGGATPDSVAQAGLFTNPVHVLDLSLVLPGMILVPLWLLRRETGGYVWFPVLAVFSALMALAITGMILALHWSGLGSAGAVPIFLGMALLDLTVLVIFFRNSMKKT